MYNNYKIVVVTPSGRKRYQQILFEYLKKSSNIIDEYRIWQNTNNQEDLVFFNEIASQYPWVTIDTRSSVGGNKNIAQYFDKCCDPDTIYIRLDDDIVYLDNSFISNILNFRTNNPDFFLVFGNIINNDICNHLHHRIGAFTWNTHIPYGCAANAWQDTKLAEEIHKQFLINLSNNTINKYMFDRYIIYERSRFSINAICWFGTDMKTIYNNFGGIVHDEEHDITVNKTQALNKFNVICGSALCSHFAFFTQRDYLDNTSILNEYQKLL